MIKFPSVRAHQSATSFFSAMILVALLVLPLACKPVDQQQSLNEVKAKFEATWILEEWHVKGQAVRSPKVEGRLIFRDNFFMATLLNRAGEEPTSWYSYGKYTLDASTFSMGFDESATFKESASGITVSRKLPWEGMKSFELGMENNQLQMRPVESGPELVFEGNSFFLKFNGKTIRTYRRAGAK